MNMQYIFVINIMIIISLISCASTTKETQALHTTVMQNSSDSQKSSDEKYIRLQKINAIIANMSLAEKIGQLFIFDYRYIALKHAPYTPATTLTDDMKKEIAKLHPAGILLYKENIDTIPQVITFITEIQKLSTTPAFIAIDEEGGIVSRFRGSRIPFVSIPPLQEIGKTKNPIIAGLASRAITQQLHAFGINMNMAPMIDLADKHNPIIKPRTYNSQPTVVSAMGQAALQAAIIENVIPVVKHFPGHGATEQDSHKENTVVKKTLTELLDSDLIPFQDTINAGAPVVMSGHIIVPDVDKLPASLSSVFLQDILRTQLGFTGVIITDAMNMLGMRNFSSEKTIAVDAFLAGNDILLSPANNQQAVTSLLKAFKDGVISQARLHESLVRIIGLKLDYGILDNSLQINENNISRVLQDTSYSDAMMQYMQE